MNTPASTALQPADPAPIFAALLLLLALSGLDQTLLGTMLPTLARALGHAELAPWVFSSYLTASTIAVPIYGKLSDRIGPWPMLLTASALFLLGSVACAAAVSMPMLVAARALQGLGGGGLMTLALLTTAWLYPAAERGRRMGLVGAAYSAATLVGPLAGGALLAVLPWRWAFWLNVPFAALAWAVIRRSRFGQGAAQPARFDLLGATLLGGALAALLWATRQAIGSVDNTVAALAALALLAAWWVSARRAADPIVPLSLFGNAGFSVAAGLAALSGIVLFGSVVFVPLYLQNGVHLSAFDSATCVVPLTLGIALGAQAAGRALRAGHSLRRLAALAAGLTTIGTAAVALVLRSAPTPGWAIAAALLPIGLGLGLCFPIVSVLAQRSAPAAQLGAASALPVMLRTLGGALGVAALGAVLHRHMTDAAAAGLASPGQATQAMAAGTSVVFWWLSGAAALSMLLVTRLRGSKQQVAPSQVTRVNEQRDLTTVVKSPTIAP